jgi:hypothetical protein
MMTFEELRAQVAALTQQLQSSQVGQRTPEIRKPIQNLLDPPPSATVAKPNFFFEGRNSVERTVPGPFPAVRFRLTEQGVQERAAKNQAELDALEADGWHTGEPVTAPVSRLDAMTDALASLSEAERSAVLAEQEKTRLGTIQAQLASLSADDLARVLEASASPVKRGPGRPRKTA